MQKEREIITSMGQLLNNAYLSSILEYENSRNPFPLRQQWIEQQLGKARLYQSINQEVRQRANELEQQGLKSIDALHVASAEVAGSEYFLTCDDRLIRRYQGNIAVINPVNFALSVTGE